MSSPSVRETQQDVEYTRLLDYQEELVSEVSSVKIKLVDFSEELYKSMVISKEVKNIFATLEHDKLNYKLRARYLLEKVCEGVKRDVTVFYQFVKVLASYGGSAYRLSRHLRKESYLSEGVSGHEYQASHDGAGSSKAMLPDISLSEDDVPILMDTLVEVSNKWEEIGISLGLPRKFINRCQGSSNAVNLSNILYEWMSYYQRTDITLKKLIAPLSNQLVGISTFAVTMEMRFREAKSTNILAAKKGGSGSDGQAIDEAGSSKPVFGQAIDEAGSSGPVFGAKQSHEFDKICLSEDDISILSELLAECAFKWNMIGTSLGLPVSIMKKLGAKYFSSETDILCLRDIMMEWLTGKYQIARDTTLNNLKITLESQLVGLRAAAYHLEERFINAKRHFILNVPATKRPHLLSSNLIIVSSPYNTEVVDGKSTLLEVLVSPNQSVSYQWMKGDDPLPDDSPYSGTRSSILSISPASQGTEGKYTCQICKGREQVITRSMVLTVMFSPEKNRLLSMYRTNSEVPLDLWPPVYSSTFINLVLVNKNKSGTYNYSVRGDVADMLECKEKVEYEEVFGKYENGALVIIEGPPGSGKTTLLHKASRDWAMSGKMLKGAKLVFHIPLRNFANGKFERLTDLIKIFCRNEEECEQVVGEIERSQGEGVCFLIDGLDEYVPQDKSNSVIYELLQKTHLPSAMVIVASRPAATSTLGREAPVTRRIEVLGFTQKGFFEYIDQYPFGFGAYDYDALLSHLKAYLRSQLNVLHMCYLPVHAAMICFLYNHTKGDIPRTEGKIYEHFTISILLRRLVRESNDRVQLHSLHELGGEEGNHFRNVCHLAFDMTIHSKQVIHQCDTKVPLSCDTGPVDVPSLGLVTIDSTAGLYGLDQTYTFLHLTFQEYLAAFYIATLEEENQMEMIRLHADGHQMPMVWKFYCGMVMFEGKEAQIEHIMRSASKLQRVHCAFESQQSVVCDNVLDFGEVSSLDLTRCTLTPADLTAVGYVISTTIYSVTEVVVKWCDLHDNHVRVFLREISRNNLSSIRSLDLSYNDISVDGAAAVADELKSCIGIPRRALSNLQRLALSGNNIGADGAAALADGLKSCTDLQTLALSGNNVGSVGAAALADGLNYSNNLHALDLSDNNIGDEGAAALADGLKSCNSLQTLDLSYNNVGAEGAAALADGLKSCNRLQTLDLSYNNIGFDGATALANLKCHSCIYHD